MNLYKAITERISTREYSNRPVADELLEELKQQLQRLKPLSININVRFKLITDTDTIRKVGIGFSDGRLKINAPHCIIGIIEKKPGAMENVGFMLEQTVLKLQDKGISTCWLGSYNEEKLKHICDIKDNEKIAIAIALGYKEKRFYTTIVRKLFNTTKRKSVKEISFYKKWGNDIDEYLKGKENLKKILYMASYYPSANNQQPVRVIIEENKAMFFAHKNSEKEYYKIDGGIFMAHFYLATLEEGLNPVIFSDAGEVKNYNFSEEYVYVGGMSY